MAASGTFALPGAATAPEGAKKIDVTFKTLTLTLLNQAFVDGMNEGNFCGHSDWVINVAKDISSCGAIPLPINTVQYSIYKIDGSNLQLGDGEFGASDAQRPTALDERIYVKQ